MNTIETPKEKYYINLYTDIDTGAKVKGYWKTSEADCEIEKNKPEYGAKGGLRHRSLASLPQKTVKDLAESEGLSIAEVLSCAV